MSDPDHIYLGAWYRDLIPRLIQTLSFYPRANTHKLFEYSGYDIFIHNILFGNAQKEMNDLMAGEDKFELCYDPYRVSGSALGLASYKGIDAFKLYNFTTSGGVTSVTKEKSPDNLATDGVIDYFQVDTTMDNEEFRNFYRANVWFETPVAQNYNARHSIHERRIVHQRKVLLIPLDILPFGYSIGSSLPSAALSGDCGFIKITLHQDWLDRCFYLTKLSDVPSLHPLVNHLHYAASDVYNTGETLGSSDPRIGWVNDRSLGRFGDPSFKTTNAVDAVDTTGVYSAQPGNLFGTAPLNVREGIVPSTYEFEAGTDKAVNIGNGRYYPKTSSDTFGLKRGGDFSKNVVRTSTSKSVSKGTEIETDLLVYRLGLIDPDYYNTVKSGINLKLLQVGYQTLPCIRELLSKLPNIYITTEWDDKKFDINTTHFEINNDLYIQAIILWFIPTDKLGVESMRVYPCHYIDHELPLIAGLKLQNEQSQGTVIYDWNMLNIFNPANMRLSPLLENIGLISYSPTLTANTFPLAYYDTNISGYLKAEFQTGSGTDALSHHVNMKSGYFRVLSIGVNGVANVNLNLFRLIF
jgi:hypothetical protein